MSNGIELLPETLVGEGLKKLPKEEVIKPKVIGFYFSAHWCPPCRAFTPKLAEFYKKLNSNGKKMEIIFITCDHDEDSFKEYFSSMPWKAIYFEDETIEEIQSLYGISGIPTLLIMDNKGKIIDNKGKEAVLNFIGREEEAFKT